MAISAQISYWNSIETRRIAICWFNVHAMFSLHSHIKEVTMTSDEMPLELAKAFVDAFEIPMSEVNWELSTRTTKNWDSLRHVELVVLLEERFKVSFPASEIFLLSSARGVAEQLRNKGVHL
jgi:acyl carrier protein